MLAVLPTRPLLQRILTNLGHGFKKTDGVLKLNSV